MKKEMNRGHVADSTKNRADKRKNRWNIVVATILISPILILSIGTANAYWTQVPGSITNLKNNSYASNHINWTWKDPSDSLVSFKVSVYINGRYVAYVPRGVQHYDATNLDPNRQYTISTQASNRRGINQTWVNDTEWTSPLTITTTTTTTSTPVPTPTANTSTINDPASTSNPSTGIKIDTDKILNVTGKKTFPVGIYYACNAYWEQKGLTGSCTPSNNAGFLFSSGEDVSELTAYKKSYEDIGMYYSLPVPDVVNNMPWNLINSPYFFGYYQQDEPAESNLPTISNFYNSIKAQDTNHPIILNLGPGNMTKWAPYTDILTWDDYPFTDTTDYPREDSIYVWEWLSEQDFLMGKDINSINKPVWAVLQANGVNLPETFIPRGTSFVVPTPAEARSNTYTAITMDVKGIVYWGYEIISEDPNNTFGLYRNPVLHAYYQQLATELRSFNDWLVSPTIDYSWAYHPGSNKVTFDKVLSKNVIGTQFMNFNYILKKYKGSYYLIIVNKDSRAISNVAITVAGLTGSMTATTLGIEAQGSGQAGRTLNVNNGKFTDSFDGSVVHIYQIG